MGAVKALAAFGVGIIGVGFYWMIFNDIIVNFVTGYIISRNDQYFMLNDFLWNGLPILCFVLGCFLLIMAGMAYHKGSVSSQ